MKIPHPLSSRHPLRPAGLAALLLSLALALSSVAAAQDEAGSGAPEPMFIAVGAINGETDDGKMIEAEFGQITISTDGEKWETVFSGGRVTDNFSHGNNNLIRGLAYGDGKFIAVGNPGVRGLTSADGRNWEFVLTEEEMGGENQAPGPGGFCITFGDGVFFNPSAAQHAVSKDGGETWEEIKLHSHLKEEYGLGIWGAEGAGHIRKTVFGNGRFLVIGETRWGVTADLETYEAHEKVGKDESGYPIFGNGHFIRLRPAHGHLKSKDGESWEPLIIGPDDPAEIKEQETGTFTGNEVLVEGSNGIWVSRDPELVEWKLVEKESGPGHGVMAAGKHGWIIDKAHQRFYLSKDYGKTWTEISTKEFGVRQVFYFDGQDLRGSGGG